MENIDNLKGKLIVVEGADGSGRSTQIAGLRDWLERNGFAVEEVGLKRSQLVADELERAKEGNVLCPITMSLFYATDFADQMENLIIPALRSGFIVLADRYIYTLMARAIVRGINSEWIHDVYSFAIPPHAIFYLEVTPKELAERNFRKNPILDYWESGMDMRGSLSMYENFIRYQRKMQKIFHSMQKAYPFKTIKGSRSPKVILQELQANIRTLLNLEIPPAKLKSEE